MSENKKKKSVLSDRGFYKPFDYPEFYDLYKQHFSMNWTPEETKLDDDVYDWHNKLSKAEKHFLTNIFRFFTEADVSVAGAYSEVYLPMFKLPEVRMMLLDFASREATHMRAYSYLIDTIGMPSTTYRAFYDYEVMVEKHQYFESFKDDNNEIDVRKLLKQIAAFSAFTEGMQLFSSFIMLLNFSRYNKMMGMGEIVRWSIKDEDCHYEGMAKLFKVILKENLEFHTDELRDEIYDVARKMVDLEFQFIDLCFEMGGIEGLTADETKEYVKYICDRRLIGLGYKGIFKVKTNPLPWVEEMLNAVGHANFFERRSIDYARNAYSGSWGKFWKPVSKVKF